MQKILIVTFIASFSAVCAAAQASELQTLDVSTAGTSTATPYQRAVQGIMEGASLTFGKLAQFCATQEGTEDISKFFDTYLRNIETGSRAGFMAVGAPDSGETTLTAEGRAVAARTGDNILNSAKSNPRIACQNLVSEFKSGTEIKLKAELLKECKLTSKNVTLSAPDCLVLRIVT